MGQIVGEVLRQLTEEKFIVKVDFFTIVFGMIDKSHCHERREIDIKAKIDCC